MAILQSSNGIKVEVRFAKYEYEWVYYHFYFSYGEFPLFNPGICENPYFAVDDHVNDALISTLEEALSTDKPTYWDLIEPGMLIEIKCAHVDSWEEIKNNKAISVSDAHKKRLMERDKVRAERGGKLPDDLFTLTFFIDARGLINLEDRTRHGEGNGPAVCITVGRDNLERFVEALKQEYKIFYSNNKIAIDQAHKERDLKLPEYL